MDRAKKQITLPSVPGTKTATVIINKRETSAVQELMCTDKPVTAHDLRNFIRESAGNSMDRIEVVPLDNVDLTAEFAFPFGNNGKPDGVRQQTHRMLAHGIDGDHRLSTILNGAGKLGHSRVKPICLLAVMNGGYTSANKHWGTPFVKLVVREVLPEIQEEEVAA